VTSYSDSSICWKTQIEALLKTIVLSIDTESPGRTITRSPPFAAAPEVDGVLVLPQAARPVARTANAATAERDLRTGASSRLRKWTRAQT